MYISTSIAQLRDEDTRMEAATCLARRLQSQVDSASDSAAVVRLMCAHCASDEFLLELFLELLESVEYKEPIIHSIALSAVDATEQQVQAVLDAYRELLVQDRAFLVPIVGSISELHLTTDQVCLRCVRFACARCSARSCALSP